MNRILAFALLGIAPFATAQDLNQKISIEVPAARASVALAALGKAAGITMEPAGNLRDDVFVISAHDATVDEIMRKVAEAESGKWVQQSGIYILTRESSTSVDQERAEIKARADAIAAAIAKLTKSVGNQTFDQTAAQKLAEEAHQMLDEVTQGSGPQRAKGNLLSTAAQKTPTARAIARILASIDPAKLAQIGPNQRIVFSTNPTRVQQSLSNAAYSAFTSFVNEQQLYTQAYNASQPQDPNNTRMVMMNGFGTPNMGNGDPKLGLGLGLVVVQRRMNGMLDVQILAADPKLDTIASGSYNLVLSDPAAENTSKSGEEPLKISDEAKEMAQALYGNAGGSGGVSSGTMVFRAVSVGGGGGGGDFTVSSVGGGNDKIKISPELKAKVLNPEKYEPMAFVPGEAMLALSRKTNKNLVALLPDYCFGSLTKQFANSVTASQLMSSLAPTHSLNAKTDGDWLIVSPGMPASGRANTVNRSALGTLLRSLDKNGQLRLDDLASFASAQNKTPGVSDFDVAYTRLINNSAADRDMMPLAFGSYSLYKFYGTLSGGQRDAIASGRQASFMNLSSQQLDLIADMLYNSPQGPNVQLDQQPSARQATETRSLVFSSQSGAGMPIVFGGSLSAKTERTIVVPNGVTNDGFMQGAISNDHLAQGINSQTGATAFLDPASLAFSKNSAGMPELASFSAPQYDKYRMAHQTKLSIRFMFNPRVMIMRSLTDASPDDNSQAGPYDSLPADFRQRVDQAAQQMRNAMDKLPGRGQNTPPPHG